MKTIGSKANGGAVRTNCACYLDCNAIKETIHVANIARQPTIMTHACALVAVAVSHLQRWSANMYLQKKGVAHFIGPRRKATWSYLQMRTFSIRSMIACAVWNR